MKSLPVLILFLLPLCVRAVPAFGTLQTESKHLEEEYKAGLRLAMVEIFWNRYETADGVFDDAYIESQKRRIRAFKDAGFAVTLAPGTHFVPRWLKEKPGSRFTDQHGKTSGDVDFIFNAEMRRYLARYLEKLGDELPMEDLWAIRISSGGNAELLYPDGGTYWAFGTAAQKGTGLAEGIPSCPHPGWRPGQEGLSEDQMRSWADWYVGNLSRIAGWQMTRFDAKGFRGWYQILSPGSGVRPSKYDEAISKRLPDGLTGVGCVWQKVYEFLPQKDRAVVYISSVSDHSGKNDLPRPEDIQVKLDDPQANRWSATRWQVRIAREFGMPVAGENPGYQMPSTLDAHYTDAGPQGMMANAIAAARAGNFQAFYWAHDHRLWDGTVKFSDYAGAVREIVGESPGPPSLPEIGFPEVRKPRVPASPAR